MPASGMLRLNPLGQPDASFDFRPASLDGVCTGGANLSLAILVEPDGSILVAGFFPRFFNCQTDARIVQLASDGHILRDWIVPDQASATSFRWLRDDRGRRFLQGKSEVFLFDANGATPLPQIGLGVENPLAILADGRLAGLYGFQNRNVGVFSAEGDFLGESGPFMIGGKTWNPVTLSDLTVGADGRLLIAGIFVPASTPNASPVGLILGIDPITFFPWRSIEAEIAGDGSAAGSLIRHPQGPIATRANPMSTLSPPWWGLLNAEGARLSDVAFENVVVDAAGQMHFALSGQAPNGYAIETSDDLKTWTPWFTSTETNWGMAFHTPPLPPELLGRFFRIR